MTIARRGITKITAVDYIMRTYFESLCVTIAERGTEQLRQLILLYNTHILAITVCQLQGD